MPRTKPAEQRRADLLAAAREQFLANGVAATSLEDITSRAGVSKGLFYLYFRSKDDLLLALQDQFSVELAERIRATTEAVEDWPAKLDACVTAIFDSYRERDDLHEVLFHHSGHVSASHRLTHALTLQAISDLLAGGTTAGASASRIQRRRPSCAGRARTASTRKAFSASRPRPVPGWSARHSRCSAVPLARRPPGGLKARLARYRAAGVLAVAEPPAASPSVAARCRYSWPRRTGGRRRRGASEDEPGRRHRMTRPTQPPEPPPDDFPQDGSSGRHRRDPRSPDGPYQQGPQPTFTPRGVPPEAPAPPRFTPRPDGGRRGRMTATAGAGATGHGLATAGLATAGTTSLHVPPDRAGMGGPSRRSLRARGTCPRRTRGARPGTRADDDVLRAPWVSAAVVHPVPLRRGAAAARGAAAGEARTGARRGGCPVRQATAGRRSLMFRARGNPVASRTRGRSAASRPSPPWRGQARRWPSARSPPGAAVSCARSCSRPPSGPVISPTRTTSPTRCPTPSTT